MSSPTAARTSLVGDCAAKCCSFRGDFHAGLPVFALGRFQSSHLSR
jgi:hypothetical protein